MHPRWFELFLNNVRTDKLFLKLYNEFWTQEWRAIEYDPGRRHPKHIFKDLNFINPSTMNKDRRVYGSNNIVHWFSRIVKFPELINGLSKSEENYFDINNFSVHDFMLGNHESGKI